MIILLPTQKTFSQWLIDLTRSNPSLIIPIPFKKEDWKASAMQLIQLNSLSSATLILPTATLFPNPDDWRKWAYMFIQSFSIN